MDYSEYLQYIRNTGLVPLLPMKMFDEDWEPIGPMVRSDMVKAGLIIESEDGIRIA